jgi:hypothetical protein
MKPAAAGKAATRTSQRSASLLSVCCRGEADDLIQRLHDLAPGASRHPQAAREPALAAPQTRWGKGSAVCARPRHRCPCDLHLQRVPRRLSHEQPASVGQGEWSDDFARLGLRLELHSPQENGDDHQCHVANVLGLPRSGDMQPQRAIPADGGACGLAPASAAYPNPSSRCFLPDSPAATIAYDCFRYCLSSASFRPGLSQACIHFIPREAR